MLGFYTSCAFQQLAFCPAQVLLPDPGEGHLVALHFFDGNAVEAALSSVYLLASAADNILQALSLKRTGEPQVEKGHNSLQRWITLCY